MIDELSRLLTTNGFLPHGYCISWSPPLLFTYVISDSLIFLSYFSMPLALGYFARRRQDFPYRWLLWMFAAFIMACGSTHLMGTLVLWKPMYALDAFLKAVTAFVSVATAIAIWPLIPHALKLPSPGQLQKANEELRNEIAERKRIEQELRIARDAAEAANRAKSVFLANMSHELRTPLNAILGFSDILRRDARLTDDMKEVLTIVHRSGDHLLGLINDILEIAKIEAGRTVLEPAPFDIGDLILNVTEMLGLRAKEKCLQLQVEQSPQFPRHIIGDEAKMRQILTNLISNAIKATEHGSVTLRLGWMKHNDTDALEIEVQDTGIGISPEDQDRIFQPFVQVGSQSKQQGTGLGLTITRQFVELMGGKLSLSSQPGQGTTFRVTLPVQLAHPDEVPPGSAAIGEVIGLAPGQPTYRVLVADDQADNSSLLVRVLERAGFAVKSVDSGAAAVEQFIAWRPHFIWMDRYMPGMDGIEATRRIRALPGGQAVKIAAATVSSFREEDGELITAGFDAIVQKPFSAEQIFESMERLLDIRFLYASPQRNIPPRIKLSASAMASVPETLRRSLAEALSLLDSQRIDEVVAEIGQVAPEVAEALHQRIHNYDYEPILALLKPDQPAAE
ncbi:MAG TPA: ATP-binding protein [Rhodocyclaceae bacterium]|nr:ATP-binding protein [Rhodocyclaceae bacterium]